MGRLRPFPDVRPPIHRLYSGNWEGGFPHKLLDYRQLPGCTFELFVDLLVRPSRVPRPRRPCLSPADRDPRNLSDPPSSPSRLGRVSMGGEGPYPPSLPRSRSLQRPVGRTVGRLFRDGSTPTLSTSGSSFHVLDVPLPGRPSVLPKVHRKGRVLYLFRFDSGAGGAPVDGRGVGHHRPETEALGATRDSRKSSGESRPPLKLGVRGEVCVIPRKTTKTNRGKVVLAGRRRGSRGGRRRRRGGVLPSGGRGTPCSRPSSGSSSSLHPHGRWSGPKHGTGLDSTNTRRKTVHTVSLPK